MNNKKFKLNPDLKKSLEVLDTMLSEKVVGGKHFSGDLELEDPCGAQCETTCAFYCIKYCEGFCGNLASKT